MTDAPTAGAVEPLQIEFPLDDPRHDDGDALLWGGPAAGREQEAGRCYTLCRTFCARNCRLCPCYPKAGDVNLFTPGNLAIPVFYTMLGFLLKFPYVALRFYLRDTLLATPSQQAIVYAVVMGMPWNFKMVYGFISDTCPIRGRRRKPYMLMGTLTCSASWLLFGVWHFPDPPGMALMCFLLFWAVLGMIFADVMADALVVERMKGEKSDRKGGIQSTCWMLRFSGSITGFLLGGWLMEVCFAPQSIFFMQGLVPLVTMLPPLFILDDPVVDGYEGRRRGGASSSSSRQIRGLSLGSMDGDNDRGDSARRSLADSGGGARENNGISTSIGAAAKAKLLQVWDCVQMNHIWMPMSFIFVFAATPSNADAFANFILGPLCFSDAMYTYLLAIGMAASLLGTFIYKRYLRTVPFRKLFCVTLVIAAAFSASQLFLITRLNKTLGIPDFLFALGDEVIVDTASFIVQMPTLVMCASLCPKGVESTLYALMTVVNNIALSVGGSFSAALADAFGITLKNFDNLWALTLLTSLSTLIPVLLIPLVPEGVEACEDSATAIDAAGEEGGRDDEEGGGGGGGGGAAAARAIPRSKYGGGGFVMVLLVGLMYSIVNAGIKLSATDPPPVVIIAPAPSLGRLSSPSPVASVNGSADVFEWQCEKEVENACGEAVDGEEDNEEAGKGPDERR